MFQKATYFPRAMLKEAKFKEPIMSKDVDVSVTKNNFF